MDAKGVLADLREMFGKRRAILSPEEVGEVIGKTPAAVAGMRSRKTFPFEVRPVGEKKLGVSIYEVADWIANGCPADDDATSGSGAAAPSGKAKKQKSPPPASSAKAKGPASANTRKPNRPSLGPALLNIRKMISQKRAELDFMTEMFAAMEALHLERGLKKPAAPRKRRRGI